MVRQSGVVLCNIFIVTTILIVLCTNYSTGEKNKYFSTESLCSPFSRMLYRTIDGAVVEAKDKTNLDCLLTFQTSSILQNFMIRFDFLQLDCEDHLYVYDGAHPFGSYVANLTCTNSNKTIQTIYTRHNFITLKYTTDSWADNSGGFKATITAFKIPIRLCTDFRCKQSQFCISKDLVNDGVSHCEDGSDEIQHNDDNTTSDPKVQ